MAQIHRFPPAGGAAVWFDPRAEAISAAVAYREAGSFSSARNVTPSIAGETAGLRELGGTGICERCA